MVPTDITKVIQMTKAFISYSVNSEDQYNADGEVFDSADYWVIEKVFVPVEERGQGKARKMLIDAIAEMKTENSMLDIKLWCDPQDDDTDSELLAAFYESVGFEATGNGAEMILC